jgi:hypothetical protein
MYAACLLFCDMALDLTGNFCKLNLRERNKEATPHTQTLCASLWTKMKRLNTKTDSEIKRFFEGRQPSLKLFNSLRKTIGKFCSPKIEVTKTQISFGEKYKYIWVWLPQTWIKKRPENSITLTIATGRKLITRTSIKKLRI